MTLNGVMVLILRYFTEFGSFQVVEDVVVKKFTFAISSPGDFLVFFHWPLKRTCGHSVIGVL